MAINREEITGIILAGGRSSRLGKDKGLCTLKGKSLVSYAGKSLVSYAVGILKPLCGDLMISANRFPERYARFGFPVIPDLVKDIGPMGGIYSCLKKSKTRHNLLLSPFVSTDVFRLLLKEAEDFQVVCPANEAFLPEPLSAYYNTNILGDLEDAIRQNEYKMMRFFKRIRFRLVKIDRNFSFFNDYLFLNLNTPFKPQYTRGFGKSRRTHAMRRRL